MAEDLWSLCLPSPNFYNLSLPSTLIAHFGGSLIILGNVLAIPGNCWRCLDHPWGCLDHSSTCHSKACVQFAPRSVLLTNFPVKNLKCVVHTHGRRGISWRKIRTQRWACDVGIPRNPKTQSSFDGLTCSVPAPPTCTLVCSRNKFAACIFCSKVNFLIVGSLHAALLHQVHFHFFFLKTIFIIVVCCVLACRTTSLATISCSCACMPYYVIDPGMQLIFFHPHATPLHWVRFFFFF